MKTKLSILILVFFAVSTAICAQVISIAAVQGETGASPYYGQTVILKGAITGTYSTGYFMRDSEEAWSGMYVYDQVNKPALGDTVQLTAIVDEYFEWTEMKSVSAFTIVSTGNPAPEPVLLSASDIDESWENCLVSIENAKCTKVTLGYGEWEVNDGSGPAVINDLGYAFSPKQNESYNITGNVSFSFLFYKIEPRFAADIQNSAVIFISSQVYPDTIRKDEISISWNTNVPGSTEVLWGLSPETGSGTFTDTTKNVTHSAKITGLFPASFYYVKPFSVTGTDTTFSKALLFSTESESTGEIRVCFTRAGIPGRASDPPGLYTSSMIDTMVSYVNLADSSLDIAIYDFTNFAATSDTRNIALIEAVNSAFQRGVRVRFLTDVNIVNEVLTSLDPAIPIIKVKTAAIMHDKFMIIDRESPSGSWLVTGSTNPTFNNLVMDFNNLVAIQDQAVAKAYTLEFNEMYGSEGESPDTLKSLIGPDKTDNTPHFFMVNGTRMEVYFSPSDFTTTHIASALNQASERIDFSMMAFTEDVLGNALVKAKSHGIKIRGEIDYIEYSGSEFSKLINAGIKVLDYKNPDGAGWPDAPTLHHKFAVVDAGTPAGTVITGSHNWTASADSKNDENTLIIHNQAISTLYKAESDRIYNWLKPMYCTNDTVNSMDESFLIIDVIANDTLPSNFTMSIVKQPVSGIATIQPNFTLTYESILNCLCNTDDTIVYQVCYTNDPDYCLQASVFINMDFSISVKTRDADYLRLWPNPVGDELQVYSEKAVAFVEIFDFTGKTVAVLNPLSSNFNIRMPGAKGIYFIGVTYLSGERQLRKVIRY